MNVNENKKMLLAYKILLALSVVLLLLSSFSMFQNIHEGRLNYEKGTLVWFLIEFNILAFAYMNIKRINAESQGKTIGDERSRRAVEKAGFFSFFLLLAALMVSGLANSIFNYLDKKGDI